MSSSTRERSGAKSTPSAAVLNEDDLCTAEEASGGTLTERMARLALSRVTAQEWAAKSGGADLRSLVRLAEGYVLRGPVDLQARLAAKELGLRLPLDPGVRRAVIHHARLAEIGYDAPRAEDALTRACWNEPGLSPAVLRRLAVGFLYAGRDVPPICPALFRGPGGALHSAPVEHGRPGLRQIGMRYTDQNGAPVFVPSEGR